jgi:hypothetical protein
MAAAIDAKSGQSQQGGTNRRRSDAYIGTTTTCASAINGLPPRSASPREIRKGQESMRPRLLAFIATLLLAPAGMAVGQTIAPLALPRSPAPLTPVTPLAPGSDIPATGLGSIGPGNVPIAPGAAASDVTGIERFGPGGVQLAPGPAGNVSGSPVLSTPAVPAPRPR